MIKNDSIQRRNVIIAEDHELVARLVKDFLLRSYPIDISIVNNQREIFNKLREEPECNLIILDLLLGSSNAVESINRISTEYPKTKIIVLSAVEDKAIIQKAFTLGASGYILKTSRLEEINEAIETVNRSEKYYSKEVVQILLGDDGINNFDRNQKEVCNINILTARQKEILQYMLEDLSNEAIADKLCISVRTIETHKRNIMNKLHVKSKYALLKLIYNH